MKYRLPPEFPQLNSSQSRHPLNLRNVGLPRQESRHKTVGPYQAE
jgi:hypothetical protein